MNSAAGKGIALRELPGRRLVAAVAGLAMLACSPVQAQMVKTGANGRPQKLFIAILDGENALNDIRERDAREPVVRVTDENHKPVAGVALLLLIRDGATGGSASFSGASSFATMTRPDGVAKTTGLEVGHTAGSFTIPVTATLGAIVGTGVIHQGNIISALHLPSDTSSGGPSTAGAQHEILPMGKAAKYVAGLVAVAGGLIAAAIVTQGGKSTSLTLGSSTVGYP
ncbi:MAG TPA: hypothetical protein VIJ79_05655 [Acidobacteriaceae bacterium]